MAGDVANDTLFFDHFILTKLYQHLIFPEIGEFCS